jgi:hypothetical protein
MIVGLFVGFVWSLYCLYFDIRQPITLVTLACTDADTAPDGTITYGIKSGNDIGLFGIDSTTGAISLISTIDYDDFVTPHTHTVRIL